MVRKHTAGAKQKISETQKRRYALQGGQTPETRQKISEAQKRRYTLIARLFAYAKETGTLQA